MNKYEAVIMFYPDVEEEKREASFTRIKGIMEKHGKINNIGEWKNLLTKLITTKKLITLL